MGKILITSPIAKTANPANIEMLVNEGHELVENLWKGPARG